MKKITSKGLTLRYCTYQILYYFMASGYFSFAATFLINKGFSASNVGVILSVGNLICCFIQPMIGDFLDRQKKFIFPKAI